MGSNKVEAVKVLETRCEYYGYSLTVAESGQVTIGIPRQKGVLTTKPARTERFDTVKDALLWMVSVMQQTNRKCSQYRVDSVWAYSDIAGTYAAIEGTCAEDKV